MFVLTCKKPKSLYIGYGQTSMHPVNIKHDAIISLQVGNRRNIFELIMFDIGLLHEYQISLENKDNNGAYYISTIYIHRQQYYE